MEVISLLITGLCLIVNTNSRLIEKITDRTLTTETKAGSSPPVRLTRQVESDALTGFSKEDHGNSEEFVQSYNRRARHFYKAKQEVPQPRKLSRKTRDSREQTGTKNKSVTTSRNRPAHPNRKPSTVAKKPIPKFTEMDYEDDFQMKISRSPIKDVMDSGDHEDEDFNLNDYDFDVNHDEFIGRGKPLEPRMKVKERARAHTPKRGGHNDKVKSKMAPVQHGAKKKERSADEIKKPGAKNDFYDEPASTASQKSDGGEELNEDNEESKEYDSKSAAVRLVRSPWKISPFADKLGDKASAVMTKILSILPMFPQVPQKKNDFEYSVDNIENDAKRRRD